MTMTIDVNVENKKLILQNEKKVLPKDGLSRVFLLHQNLRHSVTTYKSLTAHLEQKYSYVNTTYNKLGCFLIEFLVSKTIELFI